MDVTVRVRRSSHTSGGSPFVIFTDSPTNFFSAGLPTCLGELRLVYSKGEKASPRPINSEFYMGRIFVGTSIQALPSVFLFVLLVFLSFSFFFFLWFWFSLGDRLSETQRGRASIFHHCGEYLATNKLLTLKTHKKTHTHI